MFQSKLIASRKTHIFLNSTYLNFIGRYCLITNNLFFTPFFFIFLFMRKTINKNFTTPFMQKIVLSSRDGRFKFEKEFTEGKTINDIKEYLSRHIKVVQEDVEKDNINIFHNESILKDNTVLSKFQKEELNLVFDYTNKDASTTITETNVPDVSTNPINTRVSVKIIENGTKIFVDPSELITKDNKTYLVKKRTKVFNFNLLLEFVKKCKISREDILKVLIFSLLLFTNNGEILFILGTIFFLQMASSMFIKHKKHYCKKLEHLNRTVVMFVASMFMIDHSRF